MSVDKKKCDELFWWFEANKFKNTGSYKKNTNLVLEFCEYLEKTSAEMLQKSTNIFKNFTRSEVEEARKKMITGCNIWLEVIK